MNDELEKKEKELAIAKEYHKIKENQAKRIIYASEHPKEFPHRTPEDLEQSRVGVQESIEWDSQYCDKLTKEIEEIKAKRKQL